MNKKLIIFGVGEFGQLAHYYFTNDSDHSVVGFCVDKEFLDGSEFQQLPIVATEEITARFPPNQHAIFVAVGYSKMNELRAKKLNFLKKLGYEATSYISSRATVFSTLEHGENCFVLENNTIQPFVRVGSNVTLWSGNHIGHHSHIGDNTFVSSHVVISGGVTIGKNCFFGVNSTVCDHIRVGDYCMLGASSLLNRDAEAHGTYLGVPAKRSLEKDCETRV